MTDQVTHKRGYLAFDDAPPMRALINPERWNGFGFGLILFTDLAAAWESTGGWVSGDRAIIPRRWVTFGHPGDDPAVGSAILPVVRIEGTTYVNTATAGWTTSDVTDDPADLQCGNCDTPMPATVADVLDRTVAPCPSCGATPDYAHIARHGDL